MTAVVVVGAGVSGLTTAICLAERGCEVSVWARDEPASTTSAVAGAMWGPSFLEPMDRTLVWSEAGLRQFQELAGDPATGVRMTPAVSVGGPAGGGPMPPQVKLIPDLRPCPAELLPPGFDSGFQSTMPVIDMPVYLNYLLGRFRAAGGILEARTVGSLAEAARGGAVVVNCSGLGARELAGDLSVRPVRGQHVVFSNPGVTEVFIELPTGPEWTTIFPHPDKVVCGGITQPDNWDMAADDALTERIAARARVIAPALRDASIIGVTVGLRPDRPSIRVEGEQLGSSLVVHNYGHGGEGVSLSWGCAQDAADLVLKA